MTTRIDQKIRSASVVKPGSGAAPMAEVSNVVHMHEAIERSEKMIGATIKIKNAALEHAIYVTVNHIVLNAGTKNETIRPFEIFFNTKDASSQQWMLALTLLMSGIFRKGGDFAFIIDEFKGIHDPKGGSFLPGGVFVPSILAHIAIKLEEHFYEIGVMKKAQISEEARQLIETKSIEAAEVGALANAAQCPKCNEFKFVLLDGCNTCLSCGHSKCG